MNISFFILQYFQKGLCGALMLYSLAANAQGDGPRTFLLAPKDVTGINAKWMSMHQNLIPSGTIMIPKADIDVDVFPITLFHTFSLGGRFAQAYANIIPGSATAKTSIGPPIGPIPVNKISTSGLADGMFGLRIGLHGAPALNLVEFSKVPMRFSVLGDFRFIYSGTYDAEKLFNLGTNRWAFQLGVPMSIPLNQNKARATWLEIAPSLMIFTDNNNPARSARADKVEQAPLFIIENHASRNFTKKFWAFANLRFQFGGKTTVDGVEDDNNMAIMGGGAGAGYQLWSFLGINADYNGVLASNQAKGTMFRLSAVFTYANLKKAQAEATKGSR